MDVQSAMPPAASAPSASVVGVPPQIGTPVPGSSGGLPALQGLSVTQNPMASEFKSDYGYGQQGEQETGANQQGGYQTEAGAQQQQPSAYPRELPLNREQRMEGYASGGLATAAEQLRSQGRGDDTMLVHMTPNEVNSLQGLAMAHGGSLTINPETGLPEAGWLGKLLPTILGGVLAATGVGAPLAAGIVGLGQTALTGDLKKGLMAGLGAFGGASLAGAAGLGGAISKNAFGVLGDKAGLLGANMGAGAALTAPIDAGAAAAAEQVAQNLPGIPGMTTSVPSVGGGSAGFLTKFGQTATAGLPGGIISKAAPFLAAQGLIGGVSNAMTPTGGYPTQDGKIDNSYQGPYYSPRRKIVSNATTESILKGSGEQQRWFDVAMPEVRNVQGQVVQPGSGTAPGTPILQNVLNPNAKKGQPMYMQRYTPYMMSPEEQQMAQMYPGIYGGGMGYAEGGEVELSDGAFVVDARTVSELGNGSSGAGQELLAKMGGRPIRGPGDGVSDSIPARIGRDQPARVARDEVVFSPQAVEQLGKGSEKRGAQKLYALMDKAHKARRESARGKDSKLRKGLA